MTIWKVETTEGSYFAFEKANRRGMSTISFLPQPETIAMRGTIVNAVRAHSRKEKARG